ncbi:DMT family transporter [Ralstonia pickettii]|nr:DMT family transporter [Ralstonia pickettii]
MASLWMLFASFFFSLMAVCVKIAATTYSTPEILFYRSLFSVVVVGAYAVACGQRIWSPHWVAHSRRAACGVFSMSVWFYTLGVLPLALSVTLNYMSPLFISLLAGFSLLRSGGRIPFLLMVSVLFGFFGVLLLLNPSVSENQGWSVALGVFAAFVAAFAFRDVKTLTNLGEPEWRLVFYFSLFTTVAAAIGMLFHGTSEHTTLGAAALLGAGAFGTLGQLGVSLAYGRGNPMVSASLQYTGVIFSSVWGILFAKEALSSTAIWGIALIVAAGIFSVASRRRLVPS